MPVSFERFAGWTSIAVAIGGIAYSLSFVIFLNNGSDTAATVADLALMLGGFAVTAVLIAVFRRLRETEAAFALWAVLLGILGAAGSGLHGGFDLAVQVKDPAGTVSDLAANPTDPRGLATFALSGLALLLISWLIIAGGRLPKRLGYLGVLAGALLLIVYVGRLTVFNPKNPFLLTMAVLSGFVVNPAWFAWLGLVLVGRQPPALQEAATG
jgi:hypothetical protein